MTAIDAISKDEAALQTMVARLNIEHYCKILTEETDETKRQTLLHLVDEKGDIKAAVFVIHGSKDPVAPKADRDALEAEMDGAGANWQLLNFGGRLHSFAEEETMMKGVAEFNAPAAHQTYRMLDDFVQDAFNKKL